MCQEQKHIDKAIELVDKIPGRDPIQVIAMLLNKLEYKNAEIKRKDNVLRYVIEKTYMDDYGDITFETDFDETCLENVFTNKEK